MANNTKGLCNLCEKEESLIRAHIIPKCACDKKKSDVLLTLKEGDNFFNKVYQQGILDSNILCGSCDNGKLGTLDKIGRDFFKKDISKFYLSELGYYSIPNIEYNCSELKKFFVSILWRASVSKNEAFIQVDLGKKYNDLCRKFLNDEIEDVKEIDIILLKLTHYDEKMLKEFAIMPARCGRRGEYSLICCGYKIFYKVGNYSLDHSLAECKLCETRWIIHKDELSEQNEYIRMHKTAKNIPDKILR